MSNPILLAISLAVNLSGSLIRKYTSRFSDGAISRQIFIAITSAVAAASLLIGFGLGPVSAFTTLTGVAFGLVTALQQFFFLNAIEIGPFSYTAVLISLSTLIPSLSGAVFWHETISAIQIVGIALMVACFVLSANFSGDQKKASAKWLVYSFIAFLCTGLIGVMQKWHQNTVHKDELNAFLVVAFAFSFVYAAVSILLAARGDKRKNRENDRPELLRLLPVALMIVAGVCSAAENKLNLYLSGVMDSAVFFPVVNGGGLVLTTVAAILIFKERLSPRQWIGILLGIAAVILLCNPFG